MKQLSSNTSPSSHVDTDDIMDNLAVYGLARDVARDNANDTDQTGTKVFGFEGDDAEYEITTGDPFDLSEYNYPFAVIAPDSEFNLIVRKDNPEALHSLPKDKLRAMLARVLDSV